MPRIGITGHRGLNEQTTQYVTAELTAALAQYPADDLTGVSCLADGADSIFAAAVLARGGRLRGRDPGGSVPRAPARGAPPPL